MLKFYLQLGLVFLIFCAQFSLKPLVQASNNSLTLTALYQEAKPVTLNPAVASDKVSMEAIENLFIGLFS